MRKYIRHPSDIPIEVSIVEKHEHLTENLVNVSLGGLSFLAAEKLKIGRLLRLKIPFVEPEFITSAKVVWCEYNGDKGYEIGVELLDKEDVYRTRMVEQVCHIEHYKREIESTEGRHLSGAEAASEWIGKFAHEFPHFDEEEIV